MPDDLFAGAASLPFQYGGFVLKTNMTNVVASVSLLTDVRSIPPMDKPIGPPWKYIISQQIIANSRRRLIQCTGRVGVTGSRWLCYETRRFTEAGS